MGDIVHGKVYAKGKNILDYLTAFDFIKLLKDI